MENKSNKKKKKPFIDEANLVYLGDVIKIHPYTQDEANWISYIKLEMYIFKCNMNIEDVHKISRMVDDSRPKNPCKNKTIVYKTRP